MSNESKHYEPNYDTYPLLDNLNIHIRRLMKSGNIRESEDLMNFYSMLNSDINCNYYDEERDEVSQAMIRKHLLLKGYYDVK
jgi:hypothetical protein